MKILVVSDYERRGGAALATSLLCEQLVVDGHEVHHVHCRPSGAQEPWSATILHWRRARGSGSKLLRKLTPRSRRRTGDQRAVLAAFAQTIDRVRPDVVNFANIHGVLDAGWSDRMLALAAATTAACFTMHDMWWLTGRCAYSHECRKFETGCDARCPTPTEYPALAPELIHPAWLTRKLIAQAHPNIGVVPASAWIGREAAASVWGQHPTRVINYGIKSDQYPALDRAESRRELGINGDAPVLLSVAVDWGSPHKGGALLAAALAELEPIKPTLLLLGSGNVPPGLASDRVRALGYNANPRFKAAAMAAADCLVHPATAENFSNVLMEAGVCGLPVACFEIGGNPEIVTEGVSGRLSREVTGAGLAAATRASLDLGGGTQAQRDELRRHIRQQARERFSMKLQAQHYVEFYQRLIDLRNPGSR